MRTLDAACIGAKGACHPRQLATQIAIAAQSTGTTERIPLQSGVEKDGPSGVDRQSAEGRAAGGTATEALDEESRGAFTGAVPGAPGAVVPYLPGRVEEVQDSRRVLGGERRVARPGEVAHALDEDPVGRRDGRRDWVGDGGRCRPMRRGAIHLMRRWRVRADGTFKRAAFGRGARYRLAIRVHPVAPRLDDARNVEDEVCEQGDGQCSDHEYPGPSPAGKTNVADVRGSVNLGVRVPDSHAWIGSRRGHAQRRYVGGNSV